DLLIGEEQFLKPIFEQAIKILNPSVSIKGSGRATIQIHNRSDLIFELASEQAFEELSFPTAMKLYPEKTMRFQIQGKSKVLSGRKKIDLPFVAKNLLVAPERGLPIILNIEVNFIPEE
ncbi:MAG: Sb-PDE family phosphodiesterase, partial [bacterium]|nr:Sb-PDE family phosphodiesterase [bacterium]